MKGTLKKKPCILAIIILLLLPSLSKAQQIANYDFSTESGILGGCGTNDWQNANLPNWYVVTGTPEWFNTSGIPFVLMYQSASDGGVAYESFAGSYYFNVGYSYLIRVGVLSFSGGSSGCGNKIRVFAAKTPSAFPLSPVHTSSACAEPLPTTVTSANTELIGDYVAVTPVSTQVFTVVYRPTLPGLNAIWLYTERCGGGTINLTAQIDSVSIATCVDGEIDYTNSSQLAGGVIMEIGKITAGSGSSSSIVNVDPSATTVFIGREINLIQDFGAQMNQHQYFLAVASECQPCSISGPACVPIGGTITLTGSIPGGSWSSGDVSKATVNPTTGVVTGVHSTGISTVLITYTAGECVATFNLAVESSCTGGKFVANSQAQTGTLVGNEGINVNPNPTERDITISYYSQSSGTLAIGIKDVAGRTQYSEMITYDGGSNMQHVIDISALDAGVYFVDLILGDEHTVKKIVKL